MNIIERAQDLGFQIDKSPIQSGDTYLAERNTGPHLLTCRRVQNGYVVPEGFAYCFDVWECVKVK